MYVTAMTAIVIKIITATYIMACHRKCQHSSIKKSMLCNTTMHYHLVVLLIRFGYVAQALLEADGLESK